MRKKLSIIWNVTRLCPWNCKICCVGAIYVPNFTKVTSGILKSHNELSLKDKKNIVDQLSEMNVRVDFSGGELLINDENLELIKYAGLKLKKENVGISVSGMFFDRKRICDLKKYINDVELTLDIAPFEYYKIRPLGYHEYASNTIKMLKEENVSVGVQTVLTKLNIQKEKMKKLFDWIEENKVDDWSLLKYFPSGRGKKLSDYTPTEEEYIEIIDYIKEIGKNSRVQIHFQYLLPNHEKTTIKCRCVKHSIGILPNGEITACFWALDENMKAIDDKFILGDLKKDTLKSILNNKKTEYWVCQEHLCTIF